MLVELDRLAHRYHTDPWTVLHWPPERLALASMAHRAMTVELGEMCKDSPGKVQLTYGV